jgi:hypothetical protein
MLEWTCVRKEAQSESAVTPTQIENGLPRGKPLILLVAGTGFEPVTFGL